MGYPSKSHIVEAVRYPALIKDKVISDGKVVMRSPSKPLHWTGGFAVVFQIEKEGEIFAFKVWHTHLNGMGERYKLINKKLAETGLPYFLPFEYVEKGLMVNGKFLATHRMKWAAGVTLEIFIDQHLKVPDKLQSLAQKFLEMMAALQAHGIAHGDLQHGNIVVQQDGQLAVIDYDSMFVPEFKDQLDMIKGLAGYQHPERFNNATIHERMDYFSELVIYLSLLVYAEHPELWDKDTDWLLFSKDDLTDPDHSKIFHFLGKCTNSLIVYLTGCLRHALKINDLKKLTSLTDLLRRWTKPDPDLLKAITSKF